MARYERVKDDPAFAAVSQVFLLLTCLTPSGCLQAGAALIGEGAITAVVLHNVINAVYKVSTLPLE